MFTSICDRPSLENWNLGRNFPIATTFIQSLKYQYQYLQFNPKTKSCQQTPGSVHLDITLHSWEAQSWSAYWPWILCTFFLLFFTAKLSYHNFLWIQLPTWASLCILGEPGPGQPICHGGHFDALSGMTRRTALSALSPAGMCTVLLFTTMCVSKLKNYCLTQMCKMLNSRTF